MSDITAPVFTKESSSSLKKNLTTPVWEALHALKTASGYSFDQLIRSGVEQQDSSIGAYAGDQESYTLFAPLLTPIIEQYHGSAGPHPDSDFATELLQLSQAARSQIISTRIRVGRNLAGFPLGPGISREQRLMVEEKIKHALEHLPQELQGQYLSLGAMDEKLKSDLVARHLLYKSEDRFLNSANLMRDWPEARGLYLSKDEAFSVWVNEEDEIRIIALKKGGDVAEVFHLLTKGIQSLSHNLEFLFSSDLGYLTSCPTNLGTAMRASVHMKLAKLAQNETLLKQLADELGLQVRGVHGEHSKSVGGVFDISNRMRLGVTEAAAVSHLINGINTLAEKDS